MEEQQPPVDDLPPQGPGRFQFTLPTLFLVMALSAVLFWALGGMIQHQGEGDADKGRFVLITLIAPVGLVLLLATLNAIFRRRGRKKRRDRW